MSCIFLTYFVCFYIFFYKKFRLVREDISWHLSPLYITENINHNSMCTRMPQLSQTGYSKDKRNEETTYSNTNSNDRVTVV